MWNYVLTGTLVLPQTELLIHWHREILPSTEVTVGHQTEILFTIHVGIHFPRCEFRLQWGRHLDHFNVFKNLIESSQSFQFSLGSVIPESYNELDPTVRFCQLVERVGDMAIIVSQLICKTNIWLHSCTHWGRKLLHGGVQCISHLAIGLSSYPHLYL